MKVPPGVESRTARELFLGADAIKTQFIATGVVVIREDEVLRIVSGPFRVVVLQHIRPYPGHWWVAPFPEETQCLKRLLNGEELPEPCIVEAIGNKAIYMDNKWRLVEGPFAPTATLIVQVSSYNWKPIDVGLLAEGIRGGMRIALYTAEAGQRELVLKSTRSVGEYYGEHVQLPGRSVVRYKIIRW